MIYSKDCFAKYGDPNKLNNMVLYDTPVELEIGVVPKKLYCNKDFVKPFEKGIRNLIDRDFIGELKTFDGCFNIRVIRGYEKKYDELIAAGKTEEAIDLMSIHSWAIAFDVNAATNKLKATPTLSGGFVKCFTDAGFDWGGTWKRCDGMHFQLSKI